MDKDDQKEGLFKRLKNIENKIEEKLKAFGAAKLAILLKIKLILIMTINLLFTGFTKTLKFFSKSH